MRTVSVVDVSVDVLSDGYSDGNFPGTVLEITVSGSGDANAVDFAPVPSFSFTVGPDTDTSLAVPPEIEFAPENDDVDEQEETISITATANNGRDGDRHSGFAEGRRRVGGPHLAEEFE